MCWTVACESWSIISFGIYNLTTARGMLALSIIGLQGLVMEKSIFETEKKIRTVDGAACADQ